MLDRFKNFDADRIVDLNELVELSAFGRQLRAEYEALQLDEPEFVGVQIKTLRREIHARTQDALEARAREIKNRIDALKSPTERKTALQAELKQIEKQLQEVGA